MPLGEPGGDGLTHNFTLSGISPFGEIPLNNSSPAAFRVLTLSFPNWR